MEKALSEQVKEFSQSLNNHDVAYLFVGGVAIGYFGEPRPSVNLPKDVDYDIDVWYLATNENFIKLIRAISDISPELKEDLERIVFDPKKTFIKFHKEEFHFDFLPELVAFYRKDFDRCYRNKEIGEIDGVQIPILSKKDLLLDKESLARGKDLADIVNLKKYSYRGFSR